MRVYLGGFKAPVAKEPLYLLQPHSRFQKVRGDAVPQFLTAEVIERIARQRGDFKPVLLQKPGATAGLDGEFLTVL